jgi:hypothetical protein
LAPTVGIAATRFCYPGGILQVFIDKISKFRGYQEQQSDRFSRIHHQHQLSSTSLRSSMLRHQESSSPSKSTDHATSRKNRSSEKQFQYDLKDQVPSDSRVGQFLFTKAASRKSRPSCASNPVYIGSRRR